MNGIEAIREMVSTSGRTSTDISQSMGRSKNFVASTLANSRNPALATLTAIADECGYGTEFVNEATGEVIRLVK